jgi:hypothetical protein
VFEALWGARNFRILTVTASDESILNLSRQVVRITERPLTKFFLFTTPERLFSQGPLAPIWYAPQDAYDHALNHHTLKALKSAVAFSILDRAELPLSFSASPATSADPSAQ